MMLVDESAVPEQLSVHPGTHALQNARDNCTQNQICRECASEMPHGF